MLASHSTLRRGSSKDSPPNPAAAYVPERPAEAGPTATPIATPADSPPTGSTLPGPRTLWSEMQSMAERREWPSDDDSTHHSVFSEKAVHHPSKVAFGGDSVAPGANKHVARDCNSSAAGDTDVSLHSLCSMASQSQPDQTDYHVAIGVCQRNLKQEDRWTKRSVRLGALGREENVYFGMVADGHGGHEAASYVEAHLLDYLIEAAAGDASGPSILRAGIAAMERIHREILSLDPPTTAGSTVTVCVLNPSRMEVSTINVGDSEAWLVERSDGANFARRLTEDHRLDSSEPERARVAAMGGKLAHAAAANGRPSGPLRLWPGGVAQARTVGDSDVGRYILPRPFVQTVPLPEGASVLIASDGVWDAISPADVAILARAMSRSSTSATARIIVERAIEQRHAYDCAGYMQPRDDTTLLVMRVNQLGGDGTAAAADACCAIS